MEWRIWPAVIGFCDFSLRIHFGACHLRETDGRGQKSTVSGHLHLD